MACQRSDFMSWRAALVLLAFVTGCATVEGAGSGGVDGRGSGGIGGAAACDTEVVGAGEPHQNIQPSLALQYLVAAAGVLPQDGPTGTDIVIGQVNLFAGNFAPSGWLVADGQLLAIADHPSLFAVLGIAHGGDGVTSFALPDLRERAALFQGEGVGLSDRALGWTGGEEEAVLLESQLATHAHALPGADELTESSGDSEVLGVMQPSAALNAGILAVGAFPSRDGGVNDGRFIGRMHLTAGELLPDDTYPADGALLSIASNNALFSIVGTMYGGDGRQTFGAPPLPGRVVVSAGVGPGLTERLQGSMVGAESVVLEELHLPGHTHGIGDTETTEPSGGDQGYPNMQPSIAMRYIIRLTGNFPSRTGALNRDFIGEVALFAGNFAPGGWAFAEGQLLAPNSNAGLFSIIGNIYGGDGRSTFALPDLRGRAPIGGGGPESDHELGWSGGTEEVTLTEAGLPPHSHRIEPPASALLCEAP